MRFYCDVMLGKLCRWIRMAGYDCEYASENMTDQQVLEAAGHRALLTRDKALARKTGSAYYVKNTDPAKQFNELKTAFKLNPRFPENSRCPECNTLLKETGSKPPGVPEKVKSKKYWECPNCGKTYWQGSHWKRIKEVLGEND